MKPLHPIIEIEEPIYSYTPANNGAGPLWGHGNTCIVRHGDDVFVSGLETLQNAQPLHNVRWVLWRRDENGWKLQQADESGLQREPCPLGIFSDGRLLLSTNPTLTPPGSYEGPAHPHLLEFSAKNSAAPPSTLEPVWSANPGFNEHSYRSFAVDGVNGEAVLFNNFGYEDQYWSFLNRDGAWENCGVIHYMDRCCYQNIALNNRVCQMQAVDDIIEPNEAWRAWKKEFSGGREWDYVFRQLFYLCNPDIATQQFLEPLKIDDVTETAGHFRNLDLWIGQNGAAHLLYLKTNIAIPEMRDVFFPGVEITTSIELCVVQNNAVTERRTLICKTENDQQSTPIEGRLHATPEGRLFLLFSARTTNKSDEGAVENYVAEIVAGALSPPIKLDLEKPLTLFVTANERGGSAPSEFIDVYGSAAAAWGATLERDEMRYARILLA